MLDHRSLGSKAVMVDVYTEVFGPYDSGYWFLDIFDRMSVDTYCADAFKTKDDPTKKLLKVMFFYQLSIDELLLLFELPTWDSFRQIFQGKIRWMRHPHRSRWFYRNDMTVRNRWNWRGQNVFDALKEEIQRQLREKSKDKNVFEILEQYYPDDTILQVKEHYYEWFDGSDYTVDQLRISWKENYALKSAGIRTLQDFFEYLKGKTTAGTKIPGIDEIGFERLKSLAFQFAQSEISGDQVRNLCNYAETVATRECRWPIEECCASLIKDATRQSLYRLKYRDMMKVINDFKNGQLQRQCADKLPVQEATQLLKEVGYVARGEYPVIHVVTDAFWPEYLDKHPEQSIQNIRESYLRRERVWTWTWRILIRIFRRFSQEVGLYFLYCAIPEKGKSFGGNFRDGFCLHLNQSVPAKNQRVLLKARSGGRNRIPDTEKRGCMWRLQKTGNQALPCIPSIAVLNGMTMV